MKSEPTEETICIGDVITESLLRYRRSVELIREADKIVSRSTVPAIERLDAGAEQGKPADV